MKVRIGMVLALIGAVGSAACDGGSGPAPTGGTPATTVSAPPVAPAPAPAPAAREEEADPQDEPQKDYDARDKSKDGKITGTVKFTGAAPAMPDIPFAEAHCKDMHKDKPVKKEMVVVNSNGTLKNVFVYISRGAKSWKCKPPEKPAVLDQVGCVYLPHVQGMVTGQHFLIKNSDPILHNIHSQPAKNEEWNISQTGVGEVLLTPTSKFKTFTEAEVMVKIKCDVHDIMGAWVGVRPNPFFAVTGDDGSFAIEGVPAGKYELTAWHEFYGSPNSPKKTQPLKSAEFTVEPGKAVTVDFEFK